MELWINFWEKYRKNYVLRYNINITGFFKEQL